MKLEVGEEFKGQVRDLAALGAGVVDAPNGQVFFVQGTVPGDVGVFRVSSLDKRYGFATLIELLEASSERVEAPCKFHGTQDYSCQGCPWMMVRYAEQLRRKQQTVVHTLGRSKLLQDDTVVADIAPSPQQLAYRNRAQVKTDGVRLGYVGLQKNIIDIDDCKILNEVTLQKLRSLRSQLPNNTWKPAPSHAWNSIDIDDQVDITTVVLNRRLNFRQANDAQNIFMKSWLANTLQHLDTEDTDTVLELFCGSGNFTEVLSQSGFREILATEGSASAIGVLNARKLPGVKGLSIDLDKPNALSRLAKIIDAPKVLLLDPPRTGFRGLFSLLRTFSSLSHLIYISCDLPSFSYDTREIDNLGWKLRIIQPVDQFPHSPHVELMAYFARE